MLLFFNALAHFCVDGLCASVLFGRLPDSAMSLVIVYNTLAFTTQCFIGLIAGKWKEQRWAECVSILSVIMGWYLPVAPLIRVILVGLGNSLFHVTGGVMTLKRSSGKALELGIFVAPGALGLTLGVIWPQYNNIGIGKQPDWIVLILLTIAVAVRAVGGTAVNFSWKTTSALTVLMTAFVVAGKMLGGLFCDRIGPLKTALISIIPASILIAWFSDLAIPSMIGHVPLYT